MHARRAGVPVFLLVAFACLIGARRPPGSGVLDERVVPRPPYALAVRAASSAASLLSAVRWCVRPDRPRAASRIVPTACAIAAFGLAL